MGIRRIFPIVRPLAPEAFSPPFHVSALKGLRVAIDATLVTQRLHFTDDPHESRHLIGFYRLIRSLRQAGVAPIMVFDHPYKRLALKDREQLKRREKRNLDMIRSKLETERRQRLQGLSHYLKEIRALSKQDRLEAGAILQRWNARKVSEQRILATEEDEDDEYSAAMAERQALLTPTEVEQWWNELVEVSKTDAQFLAQEDEISPSFMSATESHSDDLVPISELTASDAGLTPEHVWLETASIDVDSQSRPRTIAYRINMLQTQLESSFRRLENNHSLSQKKLAEEEGLVYQHITQQLLDVPENGTLAAQDQADQAMMQALDSIQVDAKQIESATTDELAMNELPIHSPATEPFLPSLSSLEKMNSDLSRTYNRGTISLSASVYQDCAQLASLMAVPVFWTGDGTREGGGRVHEAEAYAASLVQAGYADIVASEDSDVLLYDAVLLRGLVGGAKLPQGKTRSSASDRDKRVEMVSSTRIRQALFPYDDLQKLHTQLIAQKQARLVAQAEEKEQKRLRTRNGLIPEPSQPSDTNSSPLAPLSQEEYDKMSKEMMLEFALMCGTDFNQTMPLIGPKTALKLLKQYGTISAMLEDEASKCKPPAGLSVKEYECQLRDARTVFNNPPAVRATARSVFKASKGGATQHVVAPPLADEQLFATVTGERSTMDSVAIQDSVSGLVSFDQEAVIAFLQSRNVMRFSLSEQSRNSKSSDTGEDWRDAMDLKLGLTDSSDSAASSMVTFNYYGQGTSGIACWKPTLTSGVKHETANP